MEDSIPLRGFQIKQVGPLCFPIRNSYQQIGKMERDFRTYTKEGSPREKIRLVRGGFGL